MVTGWLLDGTCKIDEWVSPLSGLQLHHMYSITPAEIYPIEIPELKVYVAETLCSTELWFLLARVLRHHGSFTVHEELEICGPECN